MTNANEGPLGNAGDLAHCYERLLDQQEGGMSRAESETAAARTGSRPVEESVAPPPLRRILEALLFVGGAPLTAARAAESVRGLAAEQFREVLDGLNREYRQQGRPYRIQVREQGCELVLQPRFRGVLDRLYGSTREARLSPAALDVLALVAYRQPIAKQEVEALRGAESGAALRQLVRLGLIAVQRGEAEQREVMYSTTPRFLTLFQLRSLDDLPRTQDLQKL
ncbi:MAG TPA: SMC-Scp complex subunit ScpB [Gemmataceae bacterium]|jgi:segregation and condensation protein B